MPGSSVERVERSLETQVSQAVDAWLAWVPRWEPATQFSVKIEGATWLGARAVLVAPVTET